MHIVLLGMMASGKSTMGKVLSRSLNAPFHDIDKIIENQEKRSIKSIFEDNGEKYFRKIENKIIIETLDLEVPSVIALGGGAFLDVIVRNYVNKKALSVWLKVDITTIIDRAKKSQNRPLIANKSDEEIKKIYNSRLEYYEMAKIHIDCNKKSKKKCIEELISAAKKIGFDESY
tara:strand:+ start:93 stop:614 length:522 start_codon:yes stop_codon:yes gene_type:complete